MRVITFSRQFPATHPRKGEPTRFVEKIHKAIDDPETPTKVSKELQSFFNFAVYNECAPKHHTIRGGNRWKEGDIFSPRVWSGRPYASKQIEFAPPIEIKKVWSFDIARGYLFLNRKCFGKFHPFNPVVQQLATNDGLDPLDMVRWFAVHPKAKHLRFSGQILCWNPEVEYLTTPQISKS